MPTLLISLSLALLCFLIARIILVKTGIFDITLGGWVVPPRDLFPPGMLNKIAGIIIFPLGLLVVTLRKRKLAKQRMLGRSTYGDELDKKRVALNHSQAETNKLRAEITELEVQMAHEQGGVYRASEAVLRKTS